MPVNLLTPWEINLKTLNDVIASRSPESQKRIKEMAEEVIQETRQKIIDAEQKTIALQYNIELHGQERTNKST
jgi:hypothetical protein